MQSEPTRAYVYQPVASTEQGPHFAISGPGSERYEDQLFTREEAQKIADKINRTAQYKSAINARRQTTFGQP